MFCIYFGKKPENYADALKLNASKFLKFFSRMLSQGIFHTEEDVEKTVEVAKACLKKL